MSARFARAPTEPRAFIAWENQRKVRYELIGGKVRLMTGSNRARLMGPASARRSASCGPPRTRGGCGGWREGRGGVR